MNSRVIIGMVAAVVAVCCVLAAIAVAGGALFLGWVTEEPEGIDVVVNTPMKVRIDEPFSIEVRVQNVAKVGQSVESIDIAAQYLEGIGIDGTEPRFYESIRGEFIYEYQSYKFRQDLPPGETLAFTFFAVGLKEGDYAADLDVCIENAGSCITLPVRTIVEK